jgi:hypothetical protein
LYLYVQQYQAKCIMSRDNYSLVFYPESSNIIDTFLFKLKLIIA